MNEYNKRDVFTHDDYLKTAADLSVDNEYITETAGFIPLEVKLKQFEQNGLIAQFQAGDFTSHDYREMYLTPDFDITPEDDFEDVQEKMELHRQFIEKYKKEKLEKISEADRAAESGEKAAKGGVNTEEEVQRKEE